MRKLFSALSTVLLLACSVAHAQASGKPAVNSDAQASFDQLKTLAGRWQGTVTTDSPAFRTDKPLPLTIRVGSQGNALIHELDTGGPELTVLYVENNHLLLTHFCDFGNARTWSRTPRPTERRSPSTSSTSQAATR